MECGDERSELTALGGNEATGHTTRRATNPFTL